MKGSRVAAVGIVLLAGAWIASGHFMPHAEKDAAAKDKPAAKDEPKLMRVAVQETNPEPHSRKLTLSGRTEADHKVMAVARTSGIISEIKVHRGQTVKKGDVIATLSDEARQARVLEAKALMAQRKAELEAKRGLIERGTMPRLDMGSLEALFRASEAAVAVAEVERDRSLVLAPWSGMIDATPMQVGQGVGPGTELAKVISLDPMLAVVEIAERDFDRVQLGSPAEVRLVTGVTAEGRVRFISKTASATTRTYRVEVEVENEDGTIPDGITAEVAIPLQSAPATRVPRSALTFSSAGELGVRAVDAKDVVGFLPVRVAEDEQQFIWVTGIGENVRVIVQGQDFVREGQHVEAVPATAYYTAGR